MLNGDRKPGEPGGWFAAFTRHQHERAVAEALARKGLRSFLPLYPMKKRWSDRVKTIEMPLFPCYVFVEANFNRRLAMLETPGIHFLVSGATGPVEIPHSEIEGIQMALSSHFLVEPFPFLNRGDHVRVAVGPLQGLEGILVRKKGRERLVLSIEMLAKSVAVEIDGSLVERTSAPASRFRGFCAQTCNAI